MQQIGVFIVYRRNIREICFLCLLLGIVTLEFAHPVVFWTNANNFFEILSKA